MSNASILRVLGARDNHESLGQLDELVEVAHVGYTSVSRSQAGLSTKVVLTMHLLAQTSKEAVSVGIPRLVDDNVGMAVFPNLSTGNVLGVNPPGKFLHNV